MADATTRLSTDYVISTGESHSIREFVEFAFKQLDIAIQWKGQGVEEYGIDLETGETIVKIDPRYYRPNEASSLVGKAEKAKKSLIGSPKQVLKNSSELWLKLIIKKYYRKENNLILTIRLFEISQFLTLSRQYVIFSFSFYFSLHAVEYDRHNSE